MRRSTSRRSVRGFLVVVELRHRTERLDVDLRIPYPIEPLRHEVRSAVLFEQSCVRERETGLARHEMIGVLDPAVADRIAELLVGAQPGELQDPRLQTV